MRSLILCLCAIVIYAWTPAAEARGRATGGCQSCAGGVCELPAAPAVEQSKPVEQAKTWPWSKPDKPIAPPAPVVVPTPAPAVEIVVPPPPAPLVEPAVPAVAVDACSSCDSGNSQAEARKPLRRILAGVAAGVGKAVQGIGRLGEAIKNRPHKPVAKAVGRLFVRRR
jgi:hypothetical protein